MSCTAHNSPQLHVAAGVLQDADGKVLVSRRPAAAQMAGKLEFPGGKIATGETPLQGLVRELREELGIDVLCARHFMRLSHEYPDFRVHLYIWRVLLWDGSLRGVEGQQLQWMVPETLISAGLLPADEPVVEHLRKNIAVNELNLPRLSPEILAAV